MSKDNWNYKHGLWWTKFYRTYYNMKSRCENPRNPRYKRYWWRWIKCEWNSLIEFKADMLASYNIHLEKYGCIDTSIDRIDNNWNYCKENCRWATNKQQCNNNSRNRKFKGLTVQQWSEKLWINVSTIRVRIHRWMSVEDAIFYNYKGIYK